MSRVRRVKGNTIVKHYRILPYSEIAEVLKEDRMAFFEDSREQPLKRGTIWKAARRLSEMMKMKVVAERVLVRLESGEGLEGYLFSVTE